jgi:very-short-patch-repair endonuclease
VRKKGDKSGPDAFIARLAARQHGVVSTDQLRSAGFSFPGINRRLETARLHRIHRGVYAVGHDRLSDHGLWMSAVLACGEGAVLSQTSAAELWGIHRRPRWRLEAGADGEPRPVHVTVPSTAGKRNRRGIVLHRSSTLIARHCTRRHGIPVTSPARTLSDLRALVSPAQFASAFREAEFLGLPVEDRFDLDHARTDLETQMLALCRRHRLPKPIVNVRVDRYVVDFLWAHQLLVVEVDGWESHRTRSAFEEDRSRDARLKILGYEVVRFTWRQVTRDRPGVAKAIRTLLHARSK